MILIKLPIQRANWKAGEGKQTYPNSDDLNKLRSILLHVDLFYQNADVDGATTTDSSNSSHKITSSDISNLCVFYGAALMGSFCPHSLSLIDYGHDVKEGELYFQTCKFVAAFIDRLNLTLNWIYF
jgi:hypothetical protein